MNKMSNATSTVIEIENYVDGGWKKSVFGDMQAYGQECVRFYTKQKSIMQR